ncbi:MAG: dienelactone hydrolase family protein, partial [Saprospiraceae bacterium]|nr:dienelactone hydrolase family protein [Saprospiraceae bacterium]
EYGIGTIRYNFPYMEKKIKRPDPPAIAHKAILQIIRHATNEYPGLVKILGGKSFGGRMASQLIAKDSLPEIQALIFYGFPLHSPAKPGTDRAAHLFEINIPMLFLQGDRDTLARLELLQPLLEKLPTAELHIFEGADHSFKFLKKSGIDETKALDLLASETSRFLNDHNI